MKCKNNFFIFWKPQKQKLTIRKSLSYKIKCVFWKTLLGLRNVRKSNKKYNVTICGIFKNESSYLKEWIEYHILIGVEHFYLYNNNSDDNFEEVTKKYIDDGVITLIEWTQNQAQMQAYMDCIKKFSGEAEWIGFIDIDEFIVLKRENSMCTILQQYKNRGSILFYWKFFGSSGIINRDKNNLVIEDFVVATDKYCNIGKCFYNTEFMFDFNSKRIKGLHHLLYTKYLIFEIPPIDQYDNFVIDAYCPIPKYDYEIQINHYAVKSFCEYKERISKGDVYFKINPHHEQKFYEIDNLCLCRDDSIYKYIDELKRILSK